jgi:response regulator RpfG family c-di-GMP phosphodiesterase
MRLFHRDDALLAVSLIVGALIVFRQPLRYPFAVAQDVEGLHDIGKVGTPDAILLKPGKLTAEEFAEMKKHCALGANTLAAVLNRHPDNQFLRLGVDVARSHHEKWDGSGTHFDPDVVAAFSALAGQFQRIRHEMQDR